jgi:hypothetical protein
MSKAKANVKVVYSLKIHLQLQERNIPYLLEMKNPSRPNFNCWVYELNSQFQKAFDEILNEGEM